MYSKSRALSSTHLGVMRRCKLTIWWRGAKTNLVFLCTNESKLIVQEEHLPFLFNHLQDLLKYRHFTWNLEHTFLLKPELLFSFPKQNPKSLVPQVLSWDDESLQLLPNTDGKKPFRYNVVLSRWDIWEGECSLNKLHASAAANRSRTVETICAIGWGWIGAGVCVFRGIC